MEVVYLGSKERRKQVTPTSQNVNRPESSGRTFDEIASLAALRQQVYRTQKEIQSLPSRAGVQVAVKHLVDAS